ncbi:TetR/AcrR family transcriptional regulator [Rhodococcus sp. UNC363MFTsu5.1]|uniref:TetR/AcrR family transcriptional regulator n=1 Tax=Rhodococcus sp. UNC363MFTsu5.1 TaxID=1449069 RepID=UPI000483D725|nr:TetR/AcrR family transcriptional regulator [Rhodococcus sp. UNC363MFTsu5.1]
MPADEEPLLTSLFAETGASDEGTDRILDAALTLFASSGIRKTTMNQIAEAAELGVATVYRRFPQKRQLVHAALLRDVSRFIAFVEASVAGIEALDDQMAVGFAAFVRGVSERPVMLSVVRGDPETGVTLLADRAILDLGRTFIARTIRPWQESGVLADFDTDMVAEIFARLAQSLILTPGGIIPAENGDNTSKFARTYLLPLLYPRIARDPD